MRAALVPLLLLLGGCVLPEPADLEFVDGPVVDDGRLVRDFSFTDGSPDCRVEFELQRGYGEPDDGCDRCDVLLAVDLVVTGDDCDGTPPSLGATAYDVSIGFDDDEAWTRESGVWERWLDGDRDGPTFEGEGSRSEAGMDVDEQLDLQWFGE